MKYKETKMCLYFLFLIYFLIIFTGSLHAELPSIEATAAVLVDSDTGQILFEKNSEIKRPPASLTKVLTAVTAIEYGKLGDSVKASKRAAFQEGSSIYLRPGEKLCLEDLLYGLMLSSGNDAAVAIAEHIGGTVAEFAELMNLVAYKAGAENSNFLNPSGLPEKGHYSTARDLAYIMCYALQNKKFAEITATKTKTIPWANHDWGRGLRNHNKLLWTYPHTTGGKTGYTKAAGRCLLVSASKEDRNLVAVVLNCSNDWLEVQNLFEFGFNDFKKIPVIKEGEVIYNLSFSEGDRENINLVAAEEIEMIIPEGGECRLRKEIEIKNDIVLPVKKGEKIGCLFLFKNSYMLGKTDLLASESVKYSSIWEKLKVKLKRGFKNQYK